MANTEFVSLRGKLKWVYVDRVNNFGDWSVTIYPDAESLEKIRELNAEGVKNRVSKDDDGWFCRFKRPPHKEVRGRMVPFTPPDVFDGTKPLPSGGFEPLRGTNIGNGSDGVVKLEVYQHNTPSGGKAKAARLNAVRIDNLVPFSGTEFTEQEKQSVKGLDKVPAEQW